MSCGNPVSRPSILARTGSKSTNQDLNSARAIASSVSFIRLFNSILSSSVPSMWAIELVALVKSGYATSRYLKVTLW